ncbi:MAG: UDP-N-acetylglucosamine--N-acetylmuramyl-(pentapeptide) pyrophosphoryl-undecaprenol N-acetylglucosamine transferase [Chlamydiae bacterium]|nr:UDP-N-acetylglucosamine--N-acetylmuramyl-(pentapeptide) pyrophosphoryl-undecaprenol N-acetylglucosamine transferase [Chlamydiota bacterium]
MEKKKRIILSAGGTGGHLFPAQEVARQLAEDAEILFVSGGLAQSHFFDGHGFSFEEIPVARFSPKKPWLWPRQLVRIVRGTWQARRIIKRFSPDSVVGFGSFFSLPVLLAAKMSSVPIFLHEQNALPGKVNRLFSAHARMTGITFPESAMRLKGKAVEVLYPSKKTKQKKDWDYFGLSDDRITLLVFGGSRGAKRLNEAFAEAIPFLVKHLPPFQVLHFTGGHNSFAPLYEEYSIPYVEKDFEPNIERAWSIADLAITRAGASTINELIDTETPGIVVPYPHASENHQVENAKHFVRQVKGGEMFFEHSLVPLRLARSICSLVALKEHLQKKIQHYKATRTEKTFASTILNE